MKFYHSISRNVPISNPLPQHSYLSTPNERLKERCLWVLFLKHLACIKMISVSHPSKWSLYSQLVISPPSANTDDLEAPPSLSKAQTAQLYCLLNCFRHSSPDMNSVTLKYFIFMEKRLLQESSGSLYIALNTYMF